MTISEEGTNEAAWNASNCNLEPIHVPGSIQSAGALVAFHTNDGVVTRASADLASTLGLASGAPIIGRRVDELLAFEGATDLPALLARIRKKTVVAAPLRLPAKHRVVMAHAHAAGEETIIEIEALATGFSEEALAARPGLQILSRILEGEGDLAGILDRVAAAFREHTGYDRVKIYEFDAEWNGDVIAESRAPEVDSYLGLKFPSSDIPAQAREILMRNWVRVIADVNAPSRALSEAPGFPPLDLTHAIFRSASPVHLEYLRNMRVGASLTVTLKVKDRLWGLIACHHRGPRHPSPFLRDYAEVVGQMVSARVESWFAREADTRRARTHGIIESLGAVLREESDLGRSLVNYSPSAVDLFDTSRTSMALHVEGRWTFKGEVPRLAELTTLLGWVRSKRPSGGVYSTHALPKEFPPARAYANVASGLLSLELSKNGGSHLFFFRPEAARIVDWAGRPDKVEVRTKNGSVDLHPRTSFAKWSESVREQSRPWREHELAALSELERVCAVREIERRVSAERVARLEVERERSRAKFLANVGNLLHENLDFEGICRTFFEQVTRGFSSGCVLAFDAAALAGAAEGDDLVRKGHATEGGLESFRDVAKWERPGKWILSDAALASAENPLKQVHRVGEGSEGAHACFVNVEAYAAFLSEFRARTLLAVPLRSHGLALGTAVFFDGPSTRPYDESDRRLAADLALRVASAVHTAALIEDLRRANQAKETFLSSVSHDLKNPLNLVALNTAVLKRLAERAPPPVTEPLSQLALSLEKSTRRMEKLIADLLDLNRMEAGKLVLEKHPHTVDRILADAAETIEPLAAQKGVAFAVIDLADSAPLECDRDRLMQVFSNLLGNAIKFTPQGGRIELAARPVADAGPGAPCEAIEFSVRDTGPGIPEESQHLVFERHWQEDKTRKLGTGLGLAIAKGIVEGHGGRIGLSSRVGEGTMFRFTIPSRGS